MTPVRFSLEVVFFTAVVLAVASLLLGWPTGTGAQTVRVFTPLVAGAVAGFVYRREDSVKTGEQQ